jgi:tRNA(Arg) A34 adenosine deaminase TadA
MAEERASERDIALMDETSADAYKALARSGAAVAALLASPEAIIARACNASEETGDLTDHAEMVLLRQTALHPVRR